MELVHLLSQAMVEPATLVTQSSTQINWLLCNGTSAFKLNIHKKNSAYRYINTIAQDKYRN